MAASAMMAISAVLMMTMRRDFSNLSAKRPAVAENRKKGRMKSPAAMVDIIWAFTPVSIAILKVTRMTSAFLKILSFKAPRNWVMNSGRKRRLFMMSRLAVLMAVLAFRGVSL